MNPIVLVAKASQARIEALRRKLSNQANDAVPQPEVPGAPFMSQNAGTYCAGDPGGDHDVPDTLPDEPAPKT